MYEILVNTIGQNHPIFVPVEDFLEGNLAEYRSLEEASAAGVKILTPLQKEKMAKPNAKIVHLDMDGVVAVFGDSVGLETLTSRGYFLNRPVQEGIIRNIQLATEREQIIPVVVTAVLLDTPYPLDEKRKWIRKYLPFVNHVVFVPYGENKAEVFTRETGVVVDENVVLIDDYSVNLYHHLEAGGSAIKFLNGINNSHADDLSHVSWVERGGATITLEGTENYDFVLSSMLTEKYGTRKEELCDPVIQLVVDLGLQGKETFFVKPNKETDSLLRYIDERINDPYPISGSGYSLDTVRKFVSRYFLTTEPCEKPFRKIKIERRPV